MKLNHHNHITYLKEKKSLLNAIVCSWKNKFYCVLNNKIRIKKYIIPVELSVRVWPSTRTQLEKPGRIWVDLGRTRIYPAVDPW